MATDVGVPQSLYRFFNAEGVLLYVGITGELGVRWTAHNTLKTWWREVATCTVEHFATRTEVEAAEIAAIKAEAPRYNIRHNEEVHARWLQANRDFVAQLVEALTVAKAIR